MFIRTEVKDQSKEQLKGRWAVTGGLFLVITIITCGIQYIPYIGVLASWIVMGAFTLTYALISLKVVDRQELSIEDAFSGFRNFVNALGLFFWQQLWVFLWSLLLIIPGIIKAYSYSMCFYVLADHPDIGICEALNKSKRITKGYKMDLFILSLSFLGWGILSVLTLGIGFFWLIPYMEVTLANVYRKLASQ